MLGRKYLVTGFIIAIVGSIIAGFAFFVIHNVALTSVGIACAVLGFSASQIPDSLAAGEAMQFLLAGSVLNTEVILEDLYSMGLLGQSGASSKSANYLQDRTNLAQRNLESDQINIDSISNAIYLPPKDGTIGVYLLLSGTLRKDIDRMWEAAKSGLIQNLLTMDSDSVNSEKIQEIIVYPLGALLGKIPNLNETDLDMQDTMSDIVVSKAEFCSGLDLTEIGNTIIIRFRDIKVNTTAVRYKEILGSIPVSLAASVIATIRKRPVLIIDEQEVAQDRVVARYKVI